jgi:hypothetical protein
MKTMLTSIVLRVFDKLDAIWEELQDRLEDDRDCHSTLFSLLLGPPQCETLQPIPVRVEVPRQSSQRYYLIL